MARRTLARCRVTARSLLNNDENGWIYRRHVGSTITHCVLLATSTTSAGITRFCLLCLFHRPLFKAFGLPLRQLLADLHGRLVSVSIITSLLLLLTSISSLFRVARRARVAAGRLLCVSVVEAPVSDGWIAKGAWPASISSTVGSTGLRRHVDASCRRYGAEAKKASVGSNIKSNVKI